MANDKNWLPIRKSNRRYEKDEKLSEAANWSLFVFTFNEEGVALEAFFTRLKELNPTIAIPDLHAFNAAAKWHCYS